MKSKNDPRVNLYDDFYNPNRLTAFHEIFYFNNLNTNRVSNNLPNQGFTGNIMAILDPFKFKKKSLSGVAHSVKNQNTESMLLNSSSDDDFTDDSSSFIPDYSLKANNSEKTKPIKGCSPEKKDRTVLIEVSVLSMDVYKKYAEDAQNFGVKYKQDLDEMYEKYFLSEKFCQKPSEIISEKNLTIYADHLNVGRFNENPDNQIKKNDLEIYEKFINERENLEVKSEQLMFCY